MSQIPDWCEKNYIWSIYIAEMCNTISSLNYIFLGVYGLKMYSKLKWYKNINYISLIFIGIGSVIFHSTLSRFGQILDELSILNAIYIGMIMINTNNIIPYILWFINVILYFYNLFYLFIMTVILSTVILIYYSYNIYKKYKHLNLEKIYNYLIIGPMLIVSAFVLFWLPEHIFCVIYNVENRGYYIQKIPLHAFWHIFSSCGIFLWIASLMDFNRIKNRYKKYDNFRVNSLQTFV